MYRIAFKELKMTLIPVRHVRMGSVLAPLPSARLAAQELRHLKVARGVTMMAAGVLIAWKASTTRTEGVRRVTIIM